MVFQLHEKTLAQNKFPASTPQFPEDLGFRSRRNGGALDDAIGEFQAGSGRGDLLADPGGDDKVGAAPHGRSKGGDAGALGGDDRKFRGEGISLGIEEAGIYGGRLVSGDKRIKALGPGKQIVGAVKRAAPDDLRPGVAGQIERTALQGSRRGHELAEDMIDLVRAYLK